MLKMVLLVREDLKMRKGKVGAQTGHATQEALIDRSSGTPVLRQDPLVYAWLASDYRKITLRVDSEAELLALHEQAREAGLHVTLVKDHGHTEFAGVHTFTCVAIGPALAEDVDKITGHLKPL